MTLKKLSVPGANPGGVDKLYGQDWNDLIDALTGSRAEDLVILGNAGLGNNKKLYNGASSSYYLLWDAQNILTFGKPRDDVNAARYEFGDVGGLLSDGAGAAFWRGLHLASPKVTVSSVDRFPRFAIYYEYDSLTDPTTKNLRVQTTNTAGAMIPDLIFGNENGDVLNLKGSRDVAMIPGKKLYLDGGGDTYVYESSANVLSFVAGGNTIFALNAEASAASVGTGYNLIVQPTQAVYFDGGSDTYIFEQSANVMRLVVGGSYGLGIDTNSIYIPATKKFFLDGGGDTYLSEQAANQIHVVTGGTVVAHLGAAGVELVGTAQAGVPGAGNINTGFATIWKDTSGGGVYLAYNDGGTIKKVQLT